MYKGVGKILVRRDVTVTSDVVAELEDPEVRALSEKTMANGVVRMFVETLGDSPRTRGWVTRTASPAGGRRFFEESFAQGLIRDPTRPETNAQNAAVGETRVAPQEAIANKAAKKKSRSGKKKGPPSVSTARGRCCVCNSSAHFARSCPKLK